LFVGSLDGVPSWRAGYQGGSQAAGDRLAPLLDLLLQLLRLVVGDEAGAVGTPELARVIIELASSGGLDGCRKLVIDHRSRTPCWGRVSQDKGQALREMTSRGGA
jgi:hypothetical protein